MELTPYKEDRLERYRDHLFTGLALVEKEQEMFQKYFFAYTLLCDGRSERQVVESLMSGETYRLGQSQAYNIVRDAQEVFGQIKQAKKDAKRNIYVTRLEELAAKLEEEGENEAAAETIMKVAKLQGLLEKNAPFIDPRLFLPKPNLIFTDDVDALELNREIEDGEGEVIDQ